MQGARDTLLSRIPEDKEHLLSFLNSKSHQASQDNPSLTQAQANQTTFDPN